jgi:glycosyltransferase involved in cell wall biosynthesis
VNNNLPKISIITPSYNQGQFIEQTILSVLEQNYPNLEYIIIDGGSTDNTVDIIKKYEKYLKYWISEPDRGQSHAINKGFLHATGDLINWINSDDWYQLGAFNELSQLAIDYPQKNIFAFIERRNMPDGTIVRLQTPLYKNLGEAIFYSEIDQPATFFRKHIWDELFPIREELHYIMDGDLWVRYILKYGFEKVYKSDFEIVNFRMHENSKTNQNNVNLGFLKDRTAIINGILRSGHFPEKLIELILEYYFLASGFTDFKPEYSIDKNQKAEIFRYFARKTAITSINKHHKQTARYASLLLLKAGYDILFSLNVLRKTIF